MNYSSYIFRHEAHSDRLALAKDSGTSPDVLRQLSDDWSYWVRMAVAQNSNTPCDVMIKLSCDREREIRQHAHSLGFWWS